MNAKRQLIVTICLIYLFMAGCSNLNWPKIQDEVSGSLGVKLLYEEFETAADRYLAIDFGTAAENANAQAVVKELNRQRVYLGHVHDQSLEGIALTYIQATSIYTAIVQVYQAGRDQYLTYLQVNGLEPDPVLVNYDNIALATGSYIEDKLSAKDLVQSNDLVELLALVLQVYAATQGIP